MHSFTHDAPSHVLTCTLSGRMDAERSSAFQVEVDAELARVADPEIEVVFDLSKVDYMASPFLRVCLTVLKRLPAGRFRIAQVSPSVQEILERSGMDGLMGGH